MALQIEEVTKAYPNGSVALDRVSLSIPKGLFGLLGPNGAGKSTLMRTIASLQRPDAGQLVFDGIDILQRPQDLRQQLGYLPQDFGVYPGISANRLLQYLARLKGIRGRSRRKDIIAHVLQLTRLSAHRHQSVSTYSGGMKRRFGIAQLLLNNPKLIVVDEPTAGLDPAERRHFLDMLSALSSDKTILFSTHIVEDVKMLCPSFAILHEGRVLLHADTQQALSDLNGQVWSADCTSQPSVAGGIVLSMATQSPTLQRYRVWSRHHPGQHFQSATPQLEDLYFLYLKQH